MVFKWGIAGAGRISHDFVTAVQNFPLKDEHKIVAVAGKNKQNVEKFAVDHSISKGYDSYLKLAEDEEVQIVYVGNLISEHFETCKIMLEHNKHVLCEKSFTVTESQTRRLVKIAREKKLFLMEAIWSRCFPAYEKMREIIENGEIGDVLFASVEFGFELQHVERMTSMKLGGGAVLDLGVYILQFQQYVFRGLKPEKMVVNGHKNVHGSDESVAAIITYPGGKMAVLSTSARVGLPNEGVVVGTKGVLRVPTVWCPTQLVTPNKTYEWPLPSEGPYLLTNSAGLAYEAEEARQCIKKGELESLKVPHEESIELARLRDFMRKELGVVFPEDSQQF